MKNYPLDDKFPQLFASFGLDLGELLKKAGLAEDLFSRRLPTATGEEYLRLMQAVGDLAPQEDFAVRLATSQGIEHCSPPVFAAYCSRNGRSCIQRLSKFKPLIGPIRYRLEELGPESTLYIEAEEPDQQLPTFIVEGEISFILRLLRSATQQPIQPLRAESSIPVSAGLQELLGISLEVTGVTALTFASSDLEIPFISHHEGMWATLEPELSRRLSQLEIDESTSARVRSALVELLPAGQSSIEDVARKLAVSSRALQRRLAQEETSFSKQLSHVRLLLAQQYLANSSMSMDSIALMLGYQEAQSFVRAFTLWTGRSPSAYREEEGR